MSFSRKIKYFLVHTLLLNNKEAQQLIDGGHIELDGLPVKENSVIDAFSEIKVNGQVVRQKTNRLYLKFHKPAGYESSLNPAVENSLSPFFKDYPGLAIAGRLDKQSEGLLLLSNDGKWIEEICSPNAQKEKEYLVALDREPAEEFFVLFSQGVRIGNYITRACRCEPAGHNSVRIFLTEGKNRQIRRMCHNLGYKVLNLKRIRIDHIHLAQLAPAEWELFLPVILQ